MTDFCEGTLDTMTERLCSAISSFDKDWVKKCVPASEKQIQQLGNICRQYGYALPEAYVRYLRAMGQSDGGLLEGEWDGHCEPNIGRILSLLGNKSWDAKYDFERGRFLLSYHWADAHSYLKVSASEPNPVVLDMDGEYFAGSFEKYLFQRAFKMYQEKFKYSAGAGTSIQSSDAVLKRYACPCSVYGGTARERMDFAECLVEPFHLEKAWFSDSLHRFYYDDSYALKIDAREGILIVFSCNEAALKEKADSELRKIFNSFS